jgi:hypothetical protein
LHGGAREHAFAVLHDARQLGRVDPVAFDPGPDREQVRVADRVFHRLYRRVDPMELRLRNLIRPTPPSAGTVLTPSSGEAIGCAGVPALFTVVMIVS